MILQVNLLSPFQGWPEDYIRYFNGNPFARVPIADERVIIGELSFVVGRQPIEHQLVQDDDRSPSVILYLTYHPRIPFDITSVEEFERLVGSLGFYREGTEEIADARAAFFDNYFGQPAPA